uniref:Uncharacterized protein n=1 Tax=Mola mola TaxID=94237 RepID=A0A3Q3WLJ7_MOLML
MQGFVDCHYFPKFLDLMCNLWSFFVCVCSHASCFPRFPGFIFPCLGVHPVQKVSPERQRGASLQDLDAALPIIQKYKDQLVAIGEVGLDFTPRYVSSDADKEGQRQVLIRQAQLAKELDLPLNVHSRSAGRPTIHLLKEQGLSSILLHNSAPVPSDSTDVFTWFVFVDFIPPSKQKLVKQLPLENICLETDSPVLGPEKQVRNEPTNISISAEYVSKIKGVSLQMVMEVTTQNALRLFPKLKSALRP